MEADAEAEIKDILDKKKAIERKVAEATEAREQLAKERESMGVMWGMCKLWIFIAAVFTLQLLT